MTNVQRLIAMGMLAVFAMSCALTEAEEHFNKGVELQNDDRYQEAIVEYTKAIELDDQLARAYTNRGNLYGQLGQFDRAIADFDQAIALDPGDALAYWNRGLARRALGEMEEANER